MKKAIVISASSDIGDALYKRWQSRGWDVYGTYRTKGDGLVYCDLLDLTSINNACSQLCALCPQWDVLVMCAGSLDPIGAFNECDFDGWEESLRVNFTSQMRIIHKLLPSRNKNALVLLFVRGGTNLNNYSAYITSKIALTKMCELLSIEIPDARFVAVSPGWVKTKIHEATLKAGTQAGATYQRTMEKLAGDESTPMEMVLDCCDWLVDAPREGISGRNFSVAEWGN